MTETLSQISATTPRLWVIKMMPMWVFFCRSFISSRIWAWMVTSRAVVGSSAMSSWGWQMRPMAIITRWRIPPESSWGYCFMRFWTLLMPTISSMDMARLAASSLETVLSWARRASMSWLPMVYTGLRQVMGFWKIMATLEPRMAIISALLLASTSSPSRVMDPPMTLPGDWSRPMMA